MAAFSQYIIYADESGSPFLGADATDFPVFVLVFVIVEKKHYVESLVPKVQLLKFNAVGHDQLILHERDIRRQANAFAFLQVNEAVRNAFIEQTTSIMETGDFSLACSIIDKNKLSEKYANPWSPYDLALTFCMEEAARVLLQKGEKNVRINVVFEARGANEDKHLELEFRRIASGKPKVGKASLAIKEFEWEPMFVDKRANSTGLHIADLAARPLGLSYLRRSQPNRAADILGTKAADILGTKMEFPQPKCFP
jgi:hypothetical protein